MTIWQTSHWKQLLLDSRQAQEVFEVDGIFVEKRSLGFGQFGLFALGITENQNVNFHKLENLAKKEKCLFVQIETFFLESFVLNTTWKKFYYKKFITPYTALINLEKSIDEILAEMKPKGRYNIKFAQKKGLIAETVEKSSENIKIFYDLMSDTTTRNHFSGNSLTYYEKFLDIIPNSELIFVKYGEVIVSAGIFVFGKEISLYYYGASSSEKEYRNLCGSYLLQFFAIQKAKDFGSKWYDFLGVAKPGENKSSLAGVTDFKLRFTSNIREVSRSYISITRPFLYFTFQILRKIKK